MSEKIRLHNEQNNIIKSQKEEIKNLHEVITALTKNKPQIRPKSSFSKTQKVILPVNENIKQELLN